MIGAQQSSLNQIYLHNDMVISNRPLYVSSDGIYGIWFNGQAAWKVGKISKLVDGKLRSGFLRNNEFTDCPSSSKRWDEWTSRKWTPNNYINIKCDGKLHFYIISRSNNNILPIKRTFI